MQKPRHFFPKSDWRERLRVVIFEAETRLGKAFDVGLLVVIIASVLLVIIESMSEVRADYPWELRAAEWLFTALFTTEYILRLICTPMPLRYARSFFGVVDLLAILPTYLSLLFPGAHSMMVIRGLRLLRIFRVFKLGRFLSEGNVLREAIWSSREKVIVFMGTVLILVTILGSAMYLIEGEENHHARLPRVPERGPRLRRRLLQALRASHAAARTTGSLTRTDADGRGGAAKETPCAGQFVERQSASRSAILSHTISGATSAPSSLSGCCRST